uniref:DWNN domain a CCHC-type zinc finger n=1 Tax=Zea mays TaxID=4577 RepID=A0A804U6E9_MAIZE
MLLFLCLNSSSLSCRATEDIVISNAQTGEEYADERASIPQNTTVLVRRISIPGQLSEKIVLSPRPEVTEECSVPCKSVVTDSSSKSCSSTVVQDEDAVIAAVIDAAELKWEQLPSKRGQDSGRFTSRRNYGPLEGETPPPGYVCRSCGVPGHFIQHCSQENKMPPPGYICYRCRIPGHFIHHCPSIGDPKFDNNKMSRSLVPVVTPVDGILDSLVPSAPAGAVDDLPAELHCRLCKKVMRDAVLTSKCCFDSFCDRCIRDYIIKESKCICGVETLADDLIPNQTLRSTISNMLGTQTSSGGSGTTRHRSSSGSNPNPKIQSHTASVASAREVKQSIDHQLPAVSAPDYVLQVATEGDLVNQPLEKLAATAEILSKYEGNSAEVSVEKAVANAEALKVKDGSETTSNATTVSGSREHDVTRTDQAKKKRKKADLTKNVQPNNVGYGYNVSFDPAYYNPFINGHPWATEPYMYSSMGMPYAGYPMDPYCANPMDPYCEYPMDPYCVNPMQGYPASYQRPETEPMRRGSTAAARAPLKHRERSDRHRPKDTRLQPQSTEHKRRLVSSHGTRSNSDRRDHGHSYGAS